MFQVKVNDQVVFELAQWELDLLANDINIADLEADLKRRLEWVLKHKVDQVFARFEKEWMDKLRDDPEVASIPKSKEAFVNLVTARVDYVSRAGRDAVSQM